LRELPDGLLREVRPKIAPSRPLNFGRDAGAWLKTRALGQASDAPSDAPYRLGEGVRHGLFGEGVVMAMEGDGEHLRVRVNFAAHGAKWLVAAYARLDKIEA